MCHRILYQGDTWRFTRPLCSGAKQEPEQFRVNGNPCSHKQLKIILTSEEVGWESAPLVELLLSCFRDFLPFVEQRDYLLSV